MTTIPTLTEQQIDSITEANNNEELIRWLATYLGDTADIPVRAPAGGDGPVYAFVPLSGVQTEEDFTAATVEELATKENLALTMIVEGGPNDNGTYSFHVVGFVMVPAFLACARVGGLVVADGVLNPSPASKEEAERLARVESLLRGMLAGEA